MRNHQKIQLRPIISQSGALQELLHSGVLWCGAQKDFQTADLQTDGEEQRERLHFSSAPFLISEIDEALHGGIQLGYIHEWSTEPLRKELSTKRLLPPHLILCSLLRNSLSRREERLSQPQIIAWIGRESWPSLHLLNLIAQGTEWDWQKQVLFIEPNSKQERLSAFRSCLSSRSVLATIGDASGFNQISTRQLQLAARIGGGIGFLLRRSDSLESSCAQTKWVVEPVKAPEERGPLKGARALSGILSWRLNLLKAQGTKTPRYWDVQLAKGALGISLLQRSEQKETDENQTTPLRKELYGS